MSDLTDPELAELTLSDPAERWQALGFNVRDGNIDLGGVRVRLGASGRGITSWAIRRLDPTGSIDGLPTVATRMPYPPPFATHPNGATGIDHVVVVTPDFNRTSAALDRAGIPLRRTLEADGVRQGFRRLGPAILELVYTPELDGADARFWGLVVIVIDLDELAERLGDQLGTIRAAVQPGRRIATLRESTGMSCAVAFMSPEPA